MKKKIFKLLIVIMILLVGCTNGLEKNEDIKFDANEDVTKKYEFSHGVSNYNFEEWTFDGKTPLIFDYFIQNHGIQSEFGLVFLADGIPQKFKIDGVETMMYTLRLNTESQLGFAIELSPEIQMSFNKINLNAFVILNPTTRIQDAKEYGANHFISNTATVNLNLLANKEMDSKTNTDIFVTYEEISDHVKDEYIKNGFNMLETDIYFGSDGDGMEEISYIDVDEDMDISILGKSGEYRLLSFINNEIVTLYDVTVVESSLTKINVKLDTNVGDNIYFLIVPREVQEPQDFVLPNQSMKWIVK